MKGVLKKVLIGAGWLLIWPASSYGACVIDGSKVQLEWTGFKTSKKIGVSGTFAKMNIKGGKGETAEAAIGSMSFELDAKSVSSGDKARDATLANVFFGEMADQTISGKVEKVEAGYAYVNLTMNKITRSVPLKLTTSGKSIVGQGYIDITDFAASKAVQALAKACFAKHEGKTWVEAAIKVTAACQ